MAPPRGGSNGPATSLAATSLLPVRFGRQASRRSRDRLERDRRSVWNGALSRDDATWRRPCSEAADGIRTHDLLHGKRQPKGPPNGQKPQ
jgi:hypothetical protein